MRSAFPSLRFAVYGFNESLVCPLISSTVREALQNPLNYACAYLAELLPPSVRRVIYLDSDLVVINDVRIVWDAAAGSDAVISAPEYCHVDFRRYFTTAFREGGYGQRAFTERRRRQTCYFNTGVMVMDIWQWRAGGYRQRIEIWMKVQLRRRIYELDSLPPFLLVFAGDVEPINHLWNQHGLGGDNLEGRCRTLHPVPVSLMHLIGKKKPWDRLDTGNPCTVDHLWAPNDLFLHSPSAA